MKRFLAFSLAVAGGSCQAADRIEEYMIYDVLCSNAKDVQILANSPLRFMGEDILLGNNQVAIRKNEQLRLALLPLKKSFSHVEAYTIPDTAFQDGLDYRTQWLTYDQLIGEWDSLITTYPWLVSKRSLGTSHEGRTIWAYRIFRPELRDVVTPPKSMLFLGDTHAREWISPSVVLHLGKKLSETLASVDNLFTDKLVDKVGVYFVPVMNPDGYYRTWNGERLWRKNRRNNGSGVYGVDLNRNYEKGWGGAGSSSSPSSDTYRGPFAASEPELQAVRNFALSLPNLLSFVDWHSYAGDILYPWSYTTSSAPSGAVAMFQAAGNATKNAITAAGGPTYVVGQGSIVLYLASGSSKDWFYDRFNIPAYTFEIDGTSFSPATTTIAPTQDHCWAGFQAFVAATAP